MAGRDIIVTDQGSVIFQEEDANGVGQAKLQAPANITTDYTIKLPAAATTSGARYVTATLADNVAELSFTSATEVGMAGLSVLGVPSTIEGEDTAADTEDSTASIAATINAAETSGAGGRNERVIFPAGGYKIKKLGVVGTHSCFQAEQGVPATQNSYWLEGAGAAHTTLFNVHDSNDPMIVHSADNGAGVQSKIFVLKDMTIDGNNRPNTSALVHLRADYIFIDNVEFRNMGPAIRFTGQPKLVAVTNCRFVDMKADTGVAIEQTLIRMDEDATDCTFIFTDNYVVGATPSAVGLGQGGVEVVSGSTGKNVHSLIRGNHFKELGNNTCAALNMTLASDSIIADNIFESMMGTAIRVKDSSNVRITGNTILSTSAKRKDADVIQGIDIEAATASRSNIEITDNIIVATTDKEFDTGIKIEGDIDDQVTFIQDVVVSNNVIDGSKVSMKVSNVSGNVSLEGNSCKNSGNITPSFAAMHIGNLNGDAQVKVIGNVFTGGAKSGRAIYMDRNSATTDSPGTVDFVLKDNFVNSMGQAAFAPVWSQAIVTDMALIYINGHNDDDVLHTFHASGNKYELTDTNANTYGLMVANVKGKCTFDSIREFGAVGDDTANDTVAINRAALAAGEGGVIYVPPGTFKVDDSGTRLTSSTALSSGTSGHAIEILFADQLWHGEGTIHKATTDKHGINCGAYRTYVKGISFQSSAASTAGSAIITSAGGEDEVTGCHFQLFGGPTVDIKGPRVLVKDCVFEGTVADAIVGVAASTDAMIYNNRIWALSVAGVDNGVKGVFVRGIITGNSFVNVGVNAIDLAAGSNQTRVSNNTIDSWGNMAVLVTGSSNVSIVDNTIHMATGESFPAIRLAAALDGVISGNTIASDGDKIQFRGVCERVSVSGNVLNMLLDGDANDHTAIEVDPSSACIGLSIVGNNISQVPTTVSSTSIGIDLGGAQYSQVTGNLIRSFNKAIIVAASKEGNMLTSNRLYQNTLDVTDGGDGTLTHYTTSTPPDLPATLQWGDSTHTSGYSGAGAVATPLLIYKSGVTADETAEAAAGGHGFNTISVTESFHYVRANTADALLHTIKINNLHTRKELDDGDDDDALACSIYDGMQIIIMSCAEVTNHDFDMKFDSAYNIGTKNRSYIGDGGGIVGANIICGPYETTKGSIDFHTPVGNNSIGPAGNVTLRFEHDGEQGVWRVIAIGAETPYIS